MRNYLAIKLFLLAIILPFTVHSKPIDVSIVNESAIYAMMASNSYLDSPKKQYFPIEKLGWKKVDLRGKDVPKDKNSYQAKTWVGKVLSNLQFDVWEDQRSTTTVIAFRGTEEKVDWFANVAVGISVPYKSAKKQVARYIAAHPDRKIIVTGHSLGGGIALSLSVWDGIDAVVFNTSPRIFDGLKNNKKPASRIAIYEANEVLQQIRSRAPKFLEAISPDEIYETKFDYAGRELHRSDLLAEGLLSCSTTPALVEFAKSINLSVKCYLK